MEDDLKKDKTEDDLKKEKWKTTSKKMKNGRRPQKKMEDKLKKIMENNLKKRKTTSKKNKKILIPLKFRGKPFLGLAQLSKLFCI